MKYYLKLLRVKHYIKNFLIFAAIIFSGQMINPKKLTDCIVGFVVFCLVSSIVYIINDIKDKNKDALHPQKRNRPIASGAISVKAAIITAVICFVLATAGFIYIFNTTALLILLAYVAINILYSFGLKNIPLVDVTILVSGFLLRVLLGAVITGIEVSNWLYLTVIAFSFFMAFGKRRNEIKTVGSNKTRNVLSAYNASFLDKSMYMCLTMANTFYALWAMSHSNNLIFITVPVVLIITLKYCLDVENETSDGDPTEVLFSDKSLIILCGIYALILLYILYFSRK